jgi:hypothetical protein
MECQKRLCQTEGCSLLQGFGKGCMKPWIPNCDSVMLIFHIARHKLSACLLESLYGHRCRTPLFWNETGERKVFRPDMLQEAEKQVRMVRENLHIAQLRKKSYADHRRRELSFEVGDFVYLKVSPMRGLHRFKIRGKLAPRFIGPFKILEK